MTRDWHVWRLVNFDYRFTDHFSWRKPRSVFNRLKWKARWAPVFSANLLRSHLREFQAAFRWLSKAQVHVWSLLVSGTERDLLTRKPKESYFHATWSKTRTSPESGDHVQHQTRGETRVLENNVVSSFPFFLFIITRIIAAVVIVESVLKEDGIPWYRDSSLFELCAL